MIYLGANEFTGNAVLCNGAQYLTLPTTSFNPSPSDVLSISGWFYLTSYSSNGRFIIFSNRLNLGGNAQGFSIAIIGNSYQIVFEQNSPPIYNGVQYLFTQSTALNRWVFFTFTKGGLSTSTWKFYLNGINIPLSSINNALTSGSTTTTGNPVVINSESYASASDCAGVYISNYTIFNKALTSTEVSSLYKFPSLIPPTASGNVIAWYKFSEYNGQTFADSSGNGYNGTLQGFTAVNTATSPNPQSGNTVWYDTKTMTAITV